MNLKVGEFYSLLMAIPCVLYGEMRISLKILHMTLIEGYSNCADRSSYSNISGTRPARFDKHAHDIEIAINVEILGDECNPSQWRFPMQQNQSLKKVGDLKCDNLPARRLLDDC